MAPGAVALPAHTFYYDLRSSFVPRDNDTFSPDPATHRSRLHTLHAKPFDHLSVWAYLAFAFIVLALTTIVAYLLYTCYHSSKKSMAMGMAAPAASIGQERINHWEYPASTSSSGTRRGAGSIVKIGIGEVGEKVNMGSSRISGNDVEMKGFSSGHKKAESDSEQNIFSLPSNSLSSVTNVNDTSFESNNHYLSSPPLAHTSDKAAAYIPFHLPPPPPSPTPAYKEHLERQYRGQTQHSPVSPSPSFSPVTSLPPITPRTASSSSLGNSDNTWSGKTTTGSTNSYRKTSGRSSKDRAPSLQFDLNNIRFVPPLNPFMTPSAVLLWKDPKLSPIHGSIISNAANTSGSSSVGDSSFSQAVLAASRSPPHEAGPQKSTKGSLPVSDYARRRKDKENADPSPFNIHSFSTTPSYDRPNTRPL